LASLCKPAVLDRLDCSAVWPGETMRRWQQEWSGMDRRAVPMMALPGGRVSRGLEALSCLADMTTADRGGAHGS
jgi:hypothetical protein